MAEYRQGWELDIEEIFLSDDLEEIVDGTRSFFREMKWEASQEQEKIWYWLACAYQHREVSRTPFFPILFLYAVCENEAFTEEKITKYMGYTVRYIYMGHGEAGSNPQSKENELKNGWLERHMNQLPQEHQRVARIYLEIVDYLFPEEDANREMENSWSNSWSAVKGSDKKGYDRQEYNRQEYESREYSRQRYDRQEHDGQEYNRQEQEEHDGQEYKNWQKLEEEEIRQEAETKKVSSKKGLLIGLIVGLLIGITLGCTGTAFLLNGYLGKEKETTAFQSNASQSDASRSDISQSGDSLPEHSSLDSSSPDSSDFSDTSDSDSLPSGTSAPDLSSDNIPSDGSADSGSNQTEESESSRDAGSREREMESF